MQMVKKKKERERKTVSHWRVLLEVQAGARSSFFFSLLFELTVNPACMKGKRNSKQLNRHRFTLTRW